MATENEVTISVEAAPADAVTETVEQTADAALETAERIADRIDDARREADTTNAQLAFIVGVLAEMSAKSEERATEIRERLDRLEAAAQLLIDAETEEIEAVADTVEAVETATETVAETAEVIDAAQAESESQKPQKRARRWL